LNELGWYGQGLNAVGNSETFSPGFPNLL